MKRKWFSLLSCVFLLSGILSPAAHAIDNPGLEDWLREHPNTVYAYTDESDADALIKTGVITEEEKDAEGYKKAFRVIDADTGETAYWVVELTGQGFHIEEEDRKEEKDGRFGDWSIPEYGDYSLSVALGFLSSGELPEENYEGIDCYTEFNNDLEEKRQSVERWFENEKTEDNDKVFEEISINDRPAYITTYTKAESEPVTRSTVNPEQVYPASFSGETKKEYRVLLDELCPGLAIELQIDAEAKGGAVGYQQDTISAGKAHYQEMVTEMDALINEYLSRDYSMSYQFVWPDGSTSVRGDSEPDMPIDTPVDTPIDTPEGPYTGGEWTHDSAAEEKGGIEIGTLIPTAAAAVIGGWFLSNIPKKKNANKAKPKKQSSSQTKAPPKQKKAEPSEDKSEEKEPEEEQFSYAIRIYKEFGDTLTCGAKEQPIYASIVRIDAQGTETTDEKLTSLLRITSPEYLRITGQQRSGRYMAAFVSAPEPAVGERIPKDAVVAFTLAANGGRFTERVHFKVKGTPKLVFAEGEGLTIEYNGQGCRMAMIEGDGLEYSLRFTLEDAMSEPTIADFYGENNGGLSTRFEKADEPYTYIAHITNNTPKKQTDVFFNRSELFTQIFVRLDEEKEPLTGDIRITLVPEGLSVLCYETKNGFMEVDTNKDISAAGLDPDIRPVRFQTVLAYTVDEADGKRAYIVDSKDYDVEFGELEGDKDYIGAFRKAFHYEINTRWAQDKDYSFAPKAVLPQPKEPYEVELPITATHKGNLFAAKLPVKLYGEQPKKVTDWDKEKELLQRALVRYGLGENEHLREQVRKAKSLTANELRMLRVAIITEAMEYYTREAMEFNSLDQSLGRYEFTFSCVKWIMDQAFAVVATRLYGSTGEAFLTPFKDLVGQFLGDLSASMYWGGELELSWREVGQTSMKSFENLAGNEIGDAISGGGNVTAAKAKKLGGVIALFLTITFIEKFYWNKDTEGDIYKSLTATFNDLAGTAIKSAFSEKFGDALKNNPKMRDSIQNYFIKDFYKRFPNANASIGHSVKFATDSVTGLINDSIEKYVTETLGLTATIFISNAEAVHEKLVDRSYRGQAKLEQIEYELESGKRSPENAAAHAIGIAYQTIGSMMEKDMFDVDIQIGDSTLRFNIIDNMNAVASFLWDKTFGTLLPKKIEKIPVTDCNQYYRIL